MTIYAIAADSETPSYTQRTAIEGTTYVLSFRWNGRDGFWYLSIADADGAPILSGMKLVIDGDLLRPAIHDPRCPPGLLVAWDMTGNEQDAGREDLGERVELRYYTTGEL